MILLLIISYECHNVMFIDCATHNQLKYVICE